MNFERIHVLDIEDTTFYEILKIPKNMDFNKIRRESLNYMIFKANRIFQG